MMDEAERKALELVGAARAERGDNRKARLGLKSDLRAARKALRKNAARKARLKAELEKS